MLGLKRGTVALVPHNPAWEREGARTVRFLKRLLGGTVLACAHVGSTAITTISAKPIIDIAVAVRSLDDAFASVPVMERAGYTHVAENDQPAHGVYGGQVFFSRRSRSRESVTHHLHFVLLGSREWVDYLAFRDYLIGRPDVAREYEAKKQLLASRYPDNREAYTAGKEEWIVPALRRARVWVWLGKTVTVTVDRPLGSVHPDHPDLRYPLNYGFVSGVTGGDGEEQDAYLIGVSRPVERFTGRVIAVIYRLDDSEDKFVVAPAGVIFHQAQILTAVHFQEQFFQIKLEHLYHRSCGMVVFRRRAGKPEYLLLRETRSTVWSIPKGHMEPGETEEETAVRELEEEAGLNSRPLPGFRTEITYPIPPIYSKTLVVFLTECDGIVTAGAGEISRYVWVDYTEAQRLLGQRKMAEPIRMADTYLRKKEGKTPAHAGRTGV